MRIERNYGVRILNNGAVFWFNIYNKNRQTLKYLDNDKNTEIKCLRLEYVSALKEKGWIANERYCGS